MNIILIGMMGAGKSVTGRLLAKKMEWQFKDVDQLIEEEQKTTIAHIFETQGENAFRQMETQMIQRLSSSDKLVIALGGGAPCFDANWNVFLKSGFVVWMKSSPQTLYNHLKNSSHVRPLLKNNLSVESISKILEARIAFYSRAHYTLETDALEPMQSAEKIAQIAHEKNYA